jgi:hypothetical protein
MRPWFTSSSNFSKSVLPFTSFIFFSFTYKINFGCQARSSHKAALGIPPAPTVMRGGSFVYWSAAADLFNSATIRVAHISSMAQATTTPSQRISQPLLPLRRYVKLLFCVCMVASSHGFGKMLPQPFNVCLYENSLVADPQGRLGNESNGKGIGNLVWLDL